MFIAAFIEFDLPGPGRRPPRKARRLLLEKRRWEPGFRVAVQLAEPATSSCQRAAYRAHPPGVSWTPRASVRLLWALRQRCCAMGFRPACGRRAEFRSWQSVSLTRREKLLPDQSRRLTLQAVGVQPLAAVWVGAYLLVPPAQDSTKLMAVPVKYRQPVPVLPKRLVGAMSGAMSGACPAPTRPRGSLQARSQRRLPAEVSCLEECVPA